MPKQCHRDRAVAGKNLLCLAITMMKNPRDMARISPFASASTSSTVQISKKSSKFYTDSSHPIVAHPTRSAARLGWWRRSWETT